MADNQQDLIAGYIDRAGVQGDTDFLLSQLKSVNDALDKLAKIKAGLGGATGAGAAGNGAAAGKAGVDELTAATEKLLKSYSGTSKQLAEVRIVQAQVNQANKDAAKEALGLVDAYAKLSKQYGESARQTQNLVVQYGAASIQAKESAASTKILYDRLVEADQAVGKFNRNVGNYPTVFKTFGETGRQAVEKVNEGFKDMYRNIAATVISFIGIRGLFEFGKESIEGFEKMEVQSLRLENALHNLGASAKDVASLKGQVIELANAFPYLSKTDLREVQQKLVQYGKISADQIKALTPTIIDFAANARIGVGEATDVIIKAMEGNARALKTYGINVKEAGSESERFALIQSELEKRVTGSAELFSESAQGKIEAYKRQLGGLKVSIGEQLIPIYETFLNVSIDVIKVIKAIDFGNVIKGIGALAAIWVIYQAAVLRANIISAFSIASQVAEKAAAESLTLAKAAETLAEETNGKVKNANTILTYLIVAAQKAYALVVRAATYETTLFNTAIKISPIGIFLGALGVAVLLFSSFSASAATSSKAVRAQAEAMKDINEAVAEGRKNSQEQIRVVEELKGKIENQNTSLTEKKRLTKELIDLDPDFLNGLKLSRDGHLEGADAIDKYIQELEKKGIAEALEAKKTPLYDQLAALDIQQPAIENARNNKAIADEASKGSVLKVGDRTYYAKAIKQQADAGVAAADEARKNIIEKIKTIDEALRAYFTTAKFNQTGLQDRLKKAGPDTTDSDDAKKAAEELAKYLAELDDKLAKAKREHAAEELKRISDDARVVVDDSRNALDKRLQAFDIYSQAQAAIINRNAESEIEQEQKKLARIAEIKKKDPYNLTDEEDKIRHTEGLVTQTIINLQQKRDDLQYKLAKDNTKLRDDIYTSSATREASDRLSAYNREKAIDQAAYSDELTRLTDAYNAKFQAAAGNTAKQERITNEYNRKRLELQDAFIIESLQKDIDFATKELEIQKLNSTNSLADQEKIAAAEQKLADLRLKLKDAETKFIIDKNNDQAKSDKDLANERVKNLEKLKGVYDDVAGLLDQVVSNITDADKSSLQSQIDAIDKKKAKEIDAVNASLLSADEKAKRIDEINARSQAKDEELQARQKQADIKKAQFEKAVGIGKIILNTAIAVAKDLADPFKVAYDIAIGAAELAIAIAAPIPRLKDGTKDSKAGPHWLGDGGKRELAIMPDGTSFISPATDSLYNLPAHTVVYPDADVFMANLMGMSFKPLATAPSLNNLTPGDIDRIMTRNFNRMIGAYTGKRETHFHWDNGQLRKAIKDGAAWTRYIQDNI